MCYERLTDLSLPSSFSNSILHVSLEFHKQIFCSFQSDMLGRDVLEEHGPLQLGRQPQLGHAAAAVEPLGPHGPADPLEAHVAQRLRPLPEWRQPLLQPQEEGPVDAGALAQLQHGPRHVGAHALRVLAHGVAEEVERGLEPLQRLPPHHLAHEGGEGGLVALRRQVANDILRSRVDLG